MNSTTGVCPPDGATGFAAASAAFGRATQAVGAVHEQHIRLAGRVMRVRVAGNHLAEELLAPFVHLRIEPAEPFFRLDLWHEEETGVGLDRPGLSPGLGTYGVVVVSEDGSVVAEHRPHASALLQRQERRIVAWVSRAGRLHLDERARPFHKPLAVALADDGVQLIHAGLVQSEGRGGLFVGMGGSGKSTSTICCLLEGLPYLGDDFVGLAVNPGGGFAGYSLYCTALINPGHMRRYPLLEPACLPGHHVEEDKSVVYFGGSVGVRLANETSIDAIILPRVTVPREDTSFRPASMRDALLALAPSSLLFLPGGGPRAMDRLGDLVTRVPAYWLELGADVRQIAPRVRELLMQQ